MNTFTKLIISIMLLCITQSGFSQQPTHADYQKMAIPFYNGSAVRAALLKQQSASDTIWLPAAVNEFRGDGTPLSRYIYEYHKDGLIKKMTCYSTSTGEIEAFVDYNNTHRDPLMDITDTIFLNGYTHPDTGEYHPTHRFYYNHREADSSYWEEYYQEWDGEKWKVAQKTMYVHLLDTLSASELQDHVELYYGNGKIDYQGSWKASFTFDEQGNVIEALVYPYDRYTHQYKLAAKDNYFYDDEGKCHTRDYYTYTSSGTWVPSMKFTNIKWFDFHGFDNGDVLFFGQILGLHYNYPLKNKNKFSSFDFWRLDDEPYGLEWIDSVKWEIEPYSYLYEHFSNSHCIAQQQYQNYNEYWDIVRRGGLNWAYSFEIPCPNWDRDPDMFWMHDFTNKYDDRGRRYEYIENQTVYPGLLPDSIFHGTWTYVIDSFTYVGCPVGIDELPLAQRELLIVPNPSNDTVRITAVDDIETITLFAADGRLAHSQAGSGKETMVNLQGLAKGIYVVQARLKNGAVQRGKVVKD